MDRQSHGRDLARQVVAGPLGCLFLPDVGQEEARLALAPAGPIRWVKTRGEGPYTISGPPAAMLACVVEVVPLAAVAEGEG